MATCFALQINVPACALLYGRASQHILPRSRVLQARVLLAENDNANDAHKQLPDDAARSALRRRLQREQGAGLRSLATDMQAAFWRGDMATYRGLLMQQMLVAQGVAILPSAL
jgi:hypothetical protein